MYHTPVRRCVFLPGVAPRPALKPLEHLFENADLSLRWGRRL
jgi:hypothetical protein